jgi:hypothetical protein
MIDFLFPYGERVKRVAGGVCECVCWLWWWGGGGGNQQFCFEELLQR